jgi:hypothetical protein
MPEEHDQHACDEHEDLVDEDEANAVLTDQVEIPMEDDDGGA